MLDNGCARQKYVVMSAKKSLLRAQREREPYVQNLLITKKIYKYSATFLLASAVALLTGCGDGGTVAGTTSVGANNTVATLQISGAPTTVQSDGSTTSLITVAAVSTTNSSIAGAVVTLVTDTGLLSASTVTTDSTGKATLTFSSGTANKDNRTATITATAGTASALLPVQVVGSTLALSATSTSLQSSGASPVTMTVTAKDAGGTAISGATVTLTQTGSATVTLTPSSGTTDASGKLSVSVAGAGVAAGTATVRAAAVGATATLDFNVTVGTTFGINQVTLNAGTAVVPTSPKATAMGIGDSLVVQVAAPGSTSVIFATTIGTWVGAPVATPNVIAVAPAAGVATATLNTASAGIANVQVYDVTTPSLSDTMSVAMTAKTAASISLQASPTVVAKSVGSTVGYSNLVASVYDATGAPVGGAPVAFSIVSGTGTNSGETVSPVVVFTASSLANGLALGAAPTTFTSGSLSSTGSGVHVRASVVGTTITTQPIPNTVTGLPVNGTSSSLDTAIFVGGTAGSVAFGQAAKIVDAGGTSTIYTFPMSVLVADSSGSPAPLGTVVSISARPIAWSTGSGCVPDADTATTGTFYNEDANDNLILDALEDGFRKRYYTGVVIAGGTLNNTITPVNSYGGTVSSTNPADLPGTTTTDASGLATFNLTYTKSSAHWIISRIRAQAVVQGTPAVGQLDFRLAASLVDSDPVNGICFLPPSPFTF